MKEGQKDSANRLAMLTAVKLYALCCPRTVPDKALTESMPILLGQYKNWWASVMHVPMDDGKDDDAISAGESAQSSSVED